MTPQSGVSFLLCCAKLENEEEPEDYDEEVREFLFSLYAGFHGYWNTLNPQLKNAAHLSAAAVTRTLRTTLSGLALVISSWQFVSAHLAVNMHTCECDGVVRRCAVKQFLWQRMLHVFAVSPVCLHSAHRNQESLNPTQTTGHY